jgi:hypothetical protein
VVARRRARVDSLARVRLEIRACTGFPGGIIFLRVWLSSMRILWGFKSRLRISGVVCVFRCCSLPLLCMYMGVALHDMASRGQG